MKTLHDFPLADISPYECSLKHRLAECASDKFLKFDNAEAYIVENDRHVSARLAFTQKVDKDEFIKVFRSRLRDIARLSKTASSVLVYIMDNVPQDKGYVVIDNMSVMEYCGFKTRKSVREGVVELLEKNFLTRSTVPKKFWINPLVLFNGNRITYAKEYILDEADED